MGVGMSNNGVPIFILFLISMWLLIVAFSFGMSKLLKVEREKWFSYNHINDLHKKIDWAIRITFTITLLVSTYYMIYSDSSETVWYFETWFLLIVFVAISESVRAYMEWRYIENRKVYVLTILEMVFMIVLVTFIVTTNFFGLF